MCGSITGGALGAMLPKELSTIVRVILALRCAISPAPSQQFASLPFASAVMTRILQTHRRC
jgi:hypothetical protein